MTCRTLKTGLSGNTLGSLLTKKRSTRRLVYLLGDTHGVAAVADQGLVVVFSLGPDCDELQGVGSGAELAVGGLHSRAGAVGQVDAAHWVL